MKKIFSPSIAFFCAVSLVSFLSSSSVFSAEKAGPKKEKTLNETHKEVKKEVQNDTEDSTADLNKGARKAKKNIQKFLNLRTDTQNPSTTQTEEKPTDKKK